MVSRRLADAWRKMSDQEKAKYAPVVAPAATGTPSKPLTSGYTLFMKERLNAGRPIGESAKDSFRRLAGEWRNLTDREKAGFNDRVAK